MTLPALLAVFSLLLSVACSSPGSVPLTLKLGLSAPFEGLYRDLGYEALHAMRLAVRQRNQAGGIAGRYQVELVALNDYNEPAEAARQAAEMAVDPGVLVVVCGLSLETAQVVVPEYERLGLPCLMPPLSAVRLGEEAARVAALELGAATAGVVQGGSAPDESLAEAFVAAFSALGGSIMLLPGPDEDSDIGLALRNLPRAPEVLFVAADTPRSAEAVASARQGGFRGQILGGPEMGSSQFVEIAGQASDGIILVSPFPPVPEEPAFVENYAALSGGALPGPVGAWAYEATNRLLDALESAGRSGGQLTRARVATALGTKVSSAGDVSVYVIRGSSVFNPR